MRALSRTHRPAPVLLLLLEQTKPNQNMQHTHRRINRKNFRIFFELPAPYPEKPFKVWRIRHHNDSNSFQLEGLILTVPKDNRHAVVAHVLPGDVVMVTHKTENGITPPNRGFQIGNDLVPVPMNNLVPFFHNYIITDGPLLDFDGTHFLHFREHDLRDFFQAKHPSWLQSHVDETLRLWRTQAPDLFTRIAPSWWASQSPWHMALMNPRVALEQHQKQLGENLRRYCIRRLVPNKDRALNRLLPTALKSGNHYENVAFLLQHHLADLDDTQLRICAFKNPQAALARYPRVTAPRIRALLLSCAFRHAWPNRALMADPAFQRDVIDSVIEHPNEWTTSNPEGLVAVLRLIAQRIPFRPTSDELKQMINGLDPALRQSVADFAAARI